MALPVRQQARYWGVAAAVLFLSLWVLGDVILPFILGGAVAYFLDPVADRLERLGLSRVASTALISVLGLLIFILIALLVLPTLTRQLVQLVNSAPEIITKLHGFVSERFPQIGDDSSTVRQTLNSFGEAIRSKGGELVNGLLTSAMSVINTVILLVVVPVVAFYMLLDWDKAVRKVDSWIPLDHRPTVRKLAREIDTVLANFVRGQLTVCLILGTFYAVSLMLVGLNFGLVVGAIAGMVTFIPYVGALLGGTLAIGLALFQFWGDWVWIGAVAGIFAVGQMLEGNVITPKLVGESVGLHPVWLLFALSAFGTLFGFVGMLVAVPVAAALGVLTRFAISQYRESLLFQGVAGVPPDQSQPQDKDF